MNSLFKLLSMSVFMGTAFIGHIGVCAQSGIPPEVRFLAAGMRYSWEKIQHAQATVTRDFITPDELLPGPNGTRTLESYGTGNGKDKVEHWSARWYYSKPELSVLVEPSISNTDKHKRYIRLVTNQDEARELTAYVKDLSVPTLGSDTNIDLHGVIFPVGGFLLDGVWAQWIQLDPRFYAYFSSRIPLDRLFLDPKYSATYEGKEILYGSQCMKIKLLRHRDMEVIYWIDTDHGYLVRHMEEHGSFNDQRVLMTEINVPKLVESSGVWLPGFVEQKIYTFGKLAVTLPKGSTGIPGLNDPRIKVGNGYVSLPPQIERNTISNFSVEAEIPPEVFALDWPVGTSVVDEITNTTFSVVREYSNSGSRLGASPMLSGQTPPEGTKK